MYTVKQVATIAGITVRTLHHYDALGLFPPARTGANGYRYYTEQSLLLLQQILFYRELGLDLEAIAKLMRQDGFSVVKALESHRRALGQRIERLQRLIQTVDNTIAQQKGDVKMNKEAWFDGLSDQEKAYADEAGQKWDPAVVKESNRRYARLTPAEKQKRKDEGEARNRSWAALIGTDPASPAAHKLVESWREEIEFFYPTTPEGLLGLAEMYNQDERFKANYDKVDPRLAAYLLECVRAFFGSSAVLGSLLVLLDDYERRFPDDTAAAQFRAFAASGEPLQGKANPRRHITASTWIVNRARTRVLLTHHAKLHKWVQLGGHTDEGEDWTAAALREAHEESGLQGLSLAQEGLFDLDVHEIPARPGQAAHDHYDLRFLVEADDRVPLVISDESHDLAWVNLADLARYTSEASQLRMAAKTSA
ncbi:MAG: TipAS antibiotic-recognition domain-containing protein [Spirochaetales bacterium]